MMKISIAFVLVVVCLISQSFLAFRTHALYPVFDPQGVNMPRNLRIAQQEKGKSSLNFQGLNNLKASGSGQFSEKNFNEMMRHLPINSQRLVVFDLREESHGFINGNPVSWTDGNYNYGNLHRTRSEIESDEYQRLRLALRTRKIIINHAQEPTKLEVHTIKTERSFVEGSGATYIRLPVTDHNRPTNAVIDQFVEVIKSLPSDQWLHFHCKAGKGRTTTFLTLLDIMKNAHQTSLNDILVRQQFIGGINLNEIQSKIGEKKRAAQARLEVIQKFYLYCRQIPDFQISWSAWAEQQQLILVKNP